MKRIYSLLMAIIFIFLISCYPVEKEIENCRCVTVCMGQSPVNFNVNFSDSLAGYPACNIMSHLLAKDDMNNYVMDLAESWSISKDGQFYTFHLAPKVKWHDGVSFTAADVKWTFEIIKEKKGVLSNRLMGIESIECPDDLTVLFKLKEPDAAFLTVVAEVFIMPKHLYEGTDIFQNAANVHPVGTGPYKFVKYNKGINITLEANAEYFRGKPEVEQLIYAIITDENTQIQAFKNGEVDILDYSSGITPSAVGELEQMKHVKVIKSMSTSRQYIAFNLKREPFNDVRVRRAVAYAVDRDEIVEKAHKGYAVKAEGFYTPAVNWAYNDKDILPNRNLALASHLLSQVYDKKDYQSIKLKNIEIVTFQFPAFVDIARVVQENLKEIGIESDITVLEYLSWYEQVKDGKFDIAIVGGDWGFDPEGLSVRVATEGFMNIMGYKNSKVDELLNQGKKTFVQEERALIYKEIQKILSEDLPVIPLTEWMYIVAMKNNITGHPIHDGLGKISTGRYSMLKIN